MTALGLYVAAIGYARSHLTDGVVPDEFLQKASRNSDAISSLRKAKLITKLRGSRWLIHDYLKWNPSAAEVERDRALNKQRQRNFRRKSTGGAEARNGVTDGGGERRSNATVTLDPQSPIPDPQVRTDTSPVRSASPTPDVPKREQRPSGRDPFPHDINDERRNDELTRAPAADGNYAVIEKLAHTVLEEWPREDAESPDVVEALKRRCAALKIDYRTDPHITRRALVSAAMQRLRMSGSIADLAMPLRKAPNGEAMGRQLKAMASRARR